MHVKDTFNPLRYLFNLYKYHCYKHDPKYVDEVFDFSTGGLSCRSCNHHIPEAESREKRYFPNENGGYTGQELELECQQLLRQHGYLIVLEDDHIMGEDGNEKTSLDLSINGSLADVRSITMNGPHTLRNGIMNKHKQLMKYNYQNHSTHDTLILHYHDPSLWNLDKIIEALSYVPTQVSHFQLRSVVCTINLNNASKEIYKSINKIRSPWFPLILVKFNRFLRRQTFHKLKRCFLVESHISKKSCSAVVIIYLI